MHTESTLRVVVLLRHDAGIIYKELWFFSRQDADFIYLITVVVPLRHDTDLIYIIVVIPLRHLLRLSFYSKWLYSDSNTLIDIDKEISTTELLSCRGDETKHLAIEACGDIPYQR